MNNKLNKCIYLEGARIFIRDLDTALPLEFDINHDFPFIKLHLLFKGKSHYEPNSERGLPITIEDGQYNFFYLPVVQGKLNMTSNFISSVDIECDEVFIKRLFKNDLFKISGCFGESIKAKLPFKMHEESQAIPPFLKNKVDEIVSSIIAGDVDIISIETKLKAIYSYLFDQIKHAGQDKQPAILKTEEREKVLRVEQILRQRIKEPITVDELAATIGTNRHKLNRDFKKVYNEPIFSYLTHLRMEKAKMMLITKKMNVSEVADMVGYKNPQHFTAAFKRYFGYVPSKLIG
ncbi:helix-turn-helix domain-containing protein [Chondrinema litorale]|uniref:helix-turn-helix domain-containing protein n=1 Tax=Chondrinema litorale TaxID=2994555 RepID=UPI002542CB41|nr:AraC family transcriptional regulator [Chondrinema litorale]UZR96364.1 AraC family transcriptional regulator [Chondrinema litorale]